MSLRARYFPRFASVSLLAFRENHYCCFCCSAKQTYMEKQLQMIF